MTRYDLAVTAASMIRDVRASPRPMAVARAALFKVIVSDLFSRDERDRVQSFVRQRELDTASHADEVARQMSELVREIEPSAFRQY